MSLWDVDRLSNLVNNLNPFMQDEIDQIAEAAYDQMIESWENDQDALGNPWQPLAPSTIAAKGHDDILVDSGDMMEAAGYEVKKSNMTATIFIDDPKIFAHEFGLEHVPRRPVLQPTLKWIEREFDDDEIGNIFDQAMFTDHGGGGAGYTVHGGGF